jgi:hypothetical protein
MSNREAGKGSKPRPFSVSQKEYDDRWDAIFGRDVKKDEKVKNESSGSNTNNRQSKIS